METLEVLKAARELINVPQKWCRNSYALTSQGIDISPAHDEASRRCAAGAVFAIAHRTNQDTYQSARDRLDEAAHALYDRGVVSLNSNRKHSDVLAVYDEAIRRLEARDGE